MARRKRKTGANGWLKQANAAPLARSGYDGANYSEKRGTIYWQTLDSRKELDAYSRGQLIRKARWLYANTGVAQRVVDGLANMVGYLTPQAASTDEGWNNLAEEVFENRCNHAPTFDRAAKHTFYQWQLMLSRLRMKDGDCMSVLSQSTGGFPQLINYEAHQIDNGTAKRDDTLMDGVRVDRFGRARAYRVVNMDNLEQFTEVPARDVIFHADFKKPGQVRGVSILAHAINHLIDRTETIAAVKHGIKIANQFGYYIENAQPNTGVNPLGQQLRTGTVTSNGKTINVHDIYESGSAPSLDQGQKLQVLHDSRPHPNQQTFLEDLIRDIAWGVGVSPEIIWKISGLTGAATRYVMAELDRWIAGQQELLQIACQRWWNYFVAKEINAGRLPMPSDGRWWACSWLPQGSLTIDRGREGNLQLAQLKVGALTKADLYAAQGADWQTKARQRVKEVQMERELCESAGLDWAEVFGGATINTQPQQPTQ